MTHSFPFNKTIDIENLRYASLAGDYLAEQFICGKGRYKVEQSWGPEGLLYLAESAYALCSLFEATGGERYEVAINEILSELSRVQKPSGGWALELGRDGDGLRFSVTDEIREATSKIEDLPPTVAILKVIADYHRLTKNTKYIDIGHKAFAYLLDYWDPDYGSFIEKDNILLSNLRSNPRSYQFFSLIGIHAWRDYDPKKVDIMLPKILYFVQQTFENFDSDTMPLIFGLHAALLSELSSDSYVDAVIKPKVEKHLIGSDTFRLSDPPGAFGHRDGLRGILTNEAHLRSAVGVLLAMKFLDLRTDSFFYRMTPMYEATSSWVKSMFLIDRFYEFQDVLTGKKFGYGSPGQYLPVWWILGKI